MTGQTFRVAVVGAGPAGLYAVAQLLETSVEPIEIDVIERLPTPWGLIRSGVAPDHGDKKQITDRLFDFYLRDGRVRFFGNVALGRDVGVAELAAWYDAVIYAHGAAAHSRIGIPGEDLAGSWGARDFVQFYNGHPDQAHLSFDLSHPRAVIVGNGNVALDVARILTANVTDLASTDIAGRALDTLRSSRVREVVILGRRNLDFAAFGNAELEELGHLPNVEVAVSGEIEPPLPGADPIGGWRAERRYELLRRLTARAPVTGAKRIVFHFLASPVALRGAGRVERLEYVNNRADQKGDAFSFTTGPAIETMEAGLVLAACGYRGVTMSGLPFEEARGIVPNREGRVLDGEVERPGAYVTGWIKRGCRGIIGSNRRCAAETVARLLADRAAGRLASDDRLSADDVGARLAAHSPAVVDFAGWRRIDRAERIAGRRAGRTREKLTNVEALVAAAHAPDPADAGSADEPSRGAA